MATQSSESLYVDSIGWKDIPRDDPSVIALRNKLQQHNGIKGLDILSPTDTKRAVELFDRDGFVVIADFLKNDQVDMLAKGCEETIKEILALDDDREGNRGSHRYSFGGSSLTRSRLHPPAWQMLLNIPELHQIVSAIFRSSDYMLRAASGDFCLPGAVNYQILHSDTSDRTSNPFTKFFSFHDPRGQQTVRDLPCPYLAVNFLPQDVTSLNGPTRQIPGTQNSRARIPNLEEEPEWMRLSTVCPAPAGAIMIRDVRAWHGGTPNISEAVRSIPNLEFYAPWYREPVTPGISYQDFKKLSEPAQKVARFHVADSSEHLEVGSILNNIFKS
ncbi:phytanoyl-CoA dioxygenase family protein [uncultured Paraglaciecola sp.]|uniref:phytanoyl-CoA dioxygenase family protein n=1 Tax=uncultured Paraglaciecola sp. TaxID=1765024 RepID=UPI0026134564|nr:phytanoyl-CoA dioxygenase family protein [uncultured Paraglaciecola sp.]